MEHDAKCEMVGMRRAWERKGFFLTTVHWRILRETSRPVMCFCLTRRGNQKKEPEYQELVLLNQNFVTFCANSGFGDPLSHNAGVERVRPQVQAGRGDGDRVIRVDFRNRRRL